MIGGRLSIRARLAVAFAGALVLVLVLMALFVYLRVGTVLNSTIDDGLASRADDLAAIVAGAEAGPPRLGNGRLVGGDEGFSQVLDSRGTVLASTLGPRAGSVLTPAEARRAARERLSPEDRKVPGVDGQARILARPAGSASSPVVVVVGATTEDRKETLAGLAGAFLIGAPIALALSCALGYLLAGRGLVPVERMRRRAADITLARSGERLPLPRADDEIHQLGATLNEMLDRIETSLERERVFVADASHELRTPLAILRTELELADRPGRSTEELRDALRSAHDEAQRLSQLAEDLLVIARSDRDGLPVARERVELNALLERVRDRFSSRAEGTGREIVVTAPPHAPADLDPLRMEQALGNLVDNALRHGAGAVRLTASRNGDGAVLEVSDAGRGFPPEFEQDAFERFTRSDEARTGGGAGLGLAIVRAIAAAHGGTVAIAHSGGPGTTVRISLPAELGEDQSAIRS